jgi:hypothetical protein
MFPQGDSRPHPECGSPKPMEDSHWGRRGTGIVKEKPRVRAEGCGRWLPEGCAQQAGAGHLARGATLVLSQPAGARCPARPQEAQNLFPRWPPWEASG